LNQINTFKSYNPKLKLHLKMHRFQNAFASTPPPCSRKVISPINSNQVAKTFDQISEKLVKMKFNIYEYMEIFLFIIQIYVLNQDSLIVAHLQMNFTIYDSSNILSK